MKRTVSVILFCFLLAGGTACTGGEDRVQNAITEEQPLTETDRKADEDDIADDADQIEEIYVERPQERSNGEICDRLEELSETSPAIADICQDLSRYPESWLEALANNPEMADFVSGYPGADRPVFPWPCITSPEERS